MNGNRFQKNKITYRFENFGGILSSQEPPFLAFVDRDYMREMGLGESPLWQAPNQSIGLLSAPTEVHFAVTNRCSVGCRHCYMDGGRTDDSEMETADFKKALDLLAGMGVFHVAMGGGEALERADLFELASYARSIGLVPNLTISGANVTAAIAAKLSVFGQVNLSLDGIGKAYGIYRGNDLFDHVDSAIDSLSAAGVPTGINCVVGRRNFDTLADVFQFAEDKGCINEIELLRFKPSGRGKSMYHEERTTYEQNIALTPMIAELSEKHDILAKIDCSFVPMLCYQRPPKEALEAMATYGCEAGNVLLGIRSNGLVSGCSFLESNGLSVFDLPCDGKKMEAFGSMLSWIDRAPEPCAGCNYVSICKGGCHGVALHVTHNYDAPDPDCPFVVEYQERRERA